MYIECKFAKHFEGTCTQNLGLMNFALRLYYPGVFLLSTANL